jgi:hypothetical protein
MLIARCAWHMQYCGRPRWGGVVSWRGFSVRFTDGICSRCLGQFREEHQAALARRRAAGARRQEVA